MKRNKNKNKKENLLPYLEKQRAEKLTEMGGYLRYLRQEQSLSLDEVAAKTKVQARLLNAIEEANLEQLPEPIYIKGFIKKYADVLGLNGAEFASSFPTGQSFQLLRPTWYTFRAPQLRPIHLYFVYVLLIIFAVSGLSHMVNSSGIQMGTANNAPKPTTTPEPSKVAKTNPPPNSNSNSLALVTSAVATNMPSTNQPVRVGVTLKAESWIRVMVDGKKEFEGVLPEGTQRTWIAQQELVVKAGNAGGVVVAVNEGEAKQLGAPGQVEEVTFKVNPKS
ncbi:MAG TPA: RodZ domain-containing protein [Leptolyngbyaceae cyanobacterium]